MKNKNSTHTFLNQTLNFYLGRTPVHNYDNGYKRIIFGIFFFIFYIIHFYSNSKTGEHTEYMAFGGSGSTITTFIKGNEENGGRRHIQHHKYSPSSSFSHPSSPSISSFSNSYNAPIESEAENEPPNPMLQMTGGRREGKPVVEVISYFLFLSFRFLLYLFSFLYSAFIFQNLFLSLFSTIYSIFSSFSLNSFFSFPHPPLLPSRFYQPFLLFFPLSPCFVFYIFLFSILYSNIRQ